MKILESTTAGIPMILKQNQTIPRHMIRIWFTYVIKKNLKKREFWAAVCVWGGTLPKREVTSSKTGEFQVKVLFPGKTPFKSECGIKTSWYIPKLRRFISNTLQTIERYDKIFQGEKRLLGKRILKIHKLKKKMSMGLHEWKHRLR